MKRRIGMLIFALATCAANAAGAADAPTPGAGYPGPQCPRPDVKLTRQQGSYSGGSWVPDNQRVKKYNQQARDYDSCMHAYIDGGNSAVKQIQDKANSDIRQITDTANSAMKDIEAKIRDAVADANAVANDEAMAAGKTAP